MNNTHVHATLAILLAALLTSDRAYAQTPSLEPPPEERGVATSMFATYIGGRELIVYPFFEHYRDGNFEYKPEELGFAGATDFRGTYRANEGLILIAYGITSNVAVEFEVATIKASLAKSGADASGLPSRFTESGIGDVEGQLRWRWRRETGARPELFSYTEVVIPHHGDKPLIGTPNLELKFGTGVIRGFTWGLLTVRGAVQYEAGSSSKFDLGEYAVEYMKQVSPRWRVFAGVEGTQDEVSLITEAQWRVSRHVVVKVNNGVGLTSKATDWAPEVGILFTSAP